MSHLEAVARIAPLLLQKEQKVSVGVGSLCIQGSRRQWQS